MSDLFDAGELSADDLEAEAAALAASLEADGVKMCERCGSRPVRARKSASGRPPTTCEVCAASKGRGPKKESAPPSVKISFGAPRKTRGDSDVALVEARAKNAALMLAAGMAMIGARDDAAILTNGAASWAAAVGGLAPYEPWLVNLCKGGEVSGRAVAWAAAVMATAGLVVPVLVIHDLIPKGPLSMMFESAAQLARQAAAEAEAEAAGGQAA